MGGKKATVKEKVTSGLVESLCAKVWFKDIIAIEGE